MERANALLAAAVFMAMIQIDEPDYAWKSGYRTSAATPPQTLFQREPTSTQSPCSGG